MTEHIKPTAPVEADRAGSPRLEPATGGVVARAPTLAPFRVRRFRYQWPADLVTSWAFEMETIILGWYVLVETRSVFMLTVFASLLYVGTLLSPMFGVAADHIGSRLLLCIMRGIYAACALVLLVTSLLGVLTPHIVLAVTLVVGLVRPSDNGMRSAQVAEIMPPGHLLGAMGIQRTTQDTARIAGALTGASLMGLLGMTSAYMVVCSFYLLSIILLVLAGGGDRTGITPGEARPSPWSALKGGFVYCWRTPHLRATMLLAFMVNFSAFPLTTHLLPVVAKDIYHSDQTTLSYMVASVAVGALIGALSLSRFAHRVSGARMMLAFAVAWYVVLAMFAHTTTPVLGIPLLMLSGLTQVLSLVPSTAMLLQSSDPRFRGRIMGIRMLAIYGNLPGLLLSAPLIGAIGFSGLALLYCGLGILVVVLIGLTWREVLWRRDAPMNRR